MCHPGSSAQIVQILFILYSTLRSETERAWFRTRVHKLSHLETMGDISCLVIIMTHKWPFHRNEHTLNQEGECDTTGGGAERGATALLTLRAGRGPARFKDSPYSEALPYLLQEEPNQLCILHKKNQSSSVQHTPAWSNAHLVYVSQPHAPL